MIGSLLLLGLVLAGILIILGATKAGRNVILVIVLIALVLPILVCLWQVFMPKIGDGAWGLLILWALMTLIGWWRVHGKEHEEELMRRYYESPYRPNIKRRIERVD